VFGEQAKKFMEGYQRTLPKRVFEVACLTFETSPNALLLKRKSVEEVRAIEAEVDFRATTPRKAITRLSKIADRHRRSLAHDDRPWRRYTDKSNAAAPLPRRR
jgi:hypothetical protein